MVKKYELGLNLPTDPRWVNIAEKNISDILVDHAYCEQKAASSCISLIVQYPDKEELVRTLTPIVAEEWGHFERVLRHLCKRGIPLAPARRDEYVRQIQKIAQKGGDRDTQLADRLLLNALIEARSCERFKLLWQHIGDAELSRFYYELMVSEAGHYKVFLSLATTYKGKDWATARWQEWLRREADVMRNMEVRGDRMH